MGPSISRWEKNKLGNRESRERKEMREKGKHGYGI